MTTLREMLDHYQSSIDMMDQHATMLETGKLRMSESEPGSGMVDISAKWAATLRKRISELEDIIKASQPYL